MGRRRSDDEYSGAESGWPRHDQTLESPDEEDRDRAGAEDDPRAHLGSYRGREGLISGQLKIRAYYTRRGKPAALITLPTEVIRAFGWQIGQYLTFYPTKGRELVLVSQDQLMVHVSPDYDLSLTSKGRPLSDEPRPGSVEARARELQMQHEAMIAKMSGAETAAAGPARSARSRGRAGRRKK